ncbi:MAG: hypothetical protein V1845_02085 [bacterium]
MAIRDNPVERYKELLGELMCSKERERVIVEKIRRISSGEEALEFFKKATRPPSAGRWLFYDEPAKRSRIIEMQNYLWMIGMEVPVSVGLVQRFLNGGKYPVMRG